MVHFPNQMAFLTRIPSIYHPHDLQHLHLPELFPVRDVELREAWYRAFCRQAELVVMMTEWGRRDLLDHYDLPSDKVAVVPWGAVTDAYPDPSQAELEPDPEVPGRPCRTASSSTRARPGRTRTTSACWRRWPLSASDTARSRRSSVRAISNELYPKLERRARELGLERHRHLRRVRRAAAAALPLRAGAPEPDLPEQVRGLGHAGDGGLLPRRPRRLFERSPRCPRWPVMPRSSLTRTDTEEMADAAWRCGRTPSSAPSLIDVDDGARLSSASSGPRGHSARTTGASRAAALRGDRD